MTQVSWKVHVNLNSIYDVIVSGLEVTTTAEVEEEEDWD